MGWDYNTDPKSKRNPALCSATGKDMFVASSYMGLIKGWWQINRKVNHATKLPDYNDREQANDVFKKVGLKNPQDVIVKVENTRPEGHAYSVRSVDMSKRVVVLPENIIKDMDKDEVSMLLAREGNMLKANETHKDLARKVLIAPAIEVAVKKAVQEPTIPGVLFAGLAAWMAKDLVLNRYRRKAITAADARTVKVMAAPKTYKRAIIREAQVRQAYKPEDDLSFLHPHPNTDFRLNTIDNTPFFTAGQNFKR
jgi:hypothetical protein